MNLFRQVLKGLIFFGNFRKLLDNIGRGVRRQISSDRFLNGEYYSEIFGNYWIILLECETTNLYKQVLKGLIYLEIIGRYCRGYRRRISSDRFLKGEFFFGNFRKLLSGL
jgi:hypothetical protein